MPKGFGAKLVDKNDLCSCKKSTITPRVCRATLLDRQRQTDRSSVILPETGSRACRRPADRELVRMVSQDETRSGRCEAVRPELQVILLPETRVGRSDKSSNKDIARLEARIAELEQRLARSGAKPESTAGALAEINEWLRMALESAQMGTWSWDVETDTIRWSDNVAPLFGLEPGESRGTFPAYLELIHPDDREMVETTVRATLASDAESYLIEHRLVLPDGNVNWIEGRGRVARDEHGRPRRIAGTVADITRRKTAEIRLRESDEAYRALIETTPSYIVNVAADHTIRFLNRTPPHMNVDDVTGARVEEFIVPEFRDAYERALSRAFATGVLQEVETRAIRPEGEPDWFLIRMGPVRRGATVESVTIAGVDITALKRTEHALRESQERLRLAAESAHFGVFDYDFVSGRAFYDRRLIEMLGLDMPQGEVPPDAWIRAVLPEDAERIRDEGARAAVEGRPLRSEYRIHRPDGEIRHLEILGSPVNDETSGKTVRMIGVCQDVTERRQLEEQLRQAQRLESVGRLAGGVAHDFNNLLTTVIGYAEILKDRIGDEPSLRAPLDQIRASADRGAALTQQLLTFAHKQVVQPKVVDLNRLIVRARDLLLRLIGEDIELRTELASSLWPVKVDPGQFEQVLVNLAVNARDAMPSGGVLTLRSGNVAPEKAGNSAADRPVSDCVLVSVSDTGVGMSEETRRQVFEPFFTTKSPGQGTGLGLSTCFGIVNREGGRIDVSSSPGKGTEFRVLLPRSPEPLVEAANGMEALELFREGRGNIDLLITDVVMPRMGGAELAEQQLGQHPELKVLFASGYASASASPQTLVDEGLNFIQKPFSPTVLTERIREILDDSE